MHGLDESVDKFSIHNGGSDNSETDSRARRNERRAQYTRRCLISTSPVVSAACQCKQKQRSHTSCNKSMQRIQAWTLTSLPRSRLCTQVHAAMRVRVSVPPTRRNARRLSTNLIRKIDDLDLEESGFYVLSCTSSSASLRIT